MKDSFQSRMLQNFPDRTWPTLVRGVGEGVRIADDVQRSTRFLSTLVGRDQRGLLRRAAIMWRLQMLCRSGELPFAAEEVLNTNGTSHLLSIVSGNIEMHVVRTEDADAFPIDAPIRQDRRATNFHDLFDDKKVVSLTDALKDVPQLYGWIAWGATRQGELTHVCLAMPERDEDAWLAHKDVLRAVLALRSKKADRDDGEQAAPNPALLLKFREEIARSLESDQRETKDENGGG